MDIEVIIRPVGQAEHIEFKDLPLYEQSAAIILLEQQLKQLSSMPTEPTVGIIQQQRFESLALQVHHARQLAYLKYAKSLTS